LGKKENDRYKNRETEIRNEESFRLKKLLN
jgi:hypothetical protein